MIKNLKLLLIPTFVCAVLVGGLWLATESATAVDDDSFIAPPGPICRNGASGVVPDFDLAYGTTGSGGMDLGFSLGFSPNIVNFPDSQGYIESIPTIRFKPKLDSNRNRIVDEYWLIGGSSDKITYPASQLHPYFSDTADAPAPYTKGMGEIIRNNPGRIWVVGNEVDREQFQDSLLPKTYARAYHDAYTYIKSVDPTAQIAVSGLVNFGPDRKQYLDLVFNEYKNLYGRTMPVDIWTMHVYNIPGRHYDNINPLDSSGSHIALGTDGAQTWKKPIFFDPSKPVGQQERFEANLCSEDDVICTNEHDDLGLFQQQVISMRQWMKDHGYQEKPLIMTEWGLNLTSDFCDEDNNRITAQRAADYLTETVNWMDSHKDSSLGYSLDEGRLVQRWAWFAIDENVPVPSIADISYLLTDYTINYPACGSTDLPSKINNPGNVDALTVVGQAYRNVIAAQHASTPPYVDFVIESVSNGGTVFDPVSGTAVSTIGLTVRNVGNSPTGQNTTVEFRDASDNSLIGTFVIPPSFQGCTTAVYHGTVQWTHTAEGTYNFNVQVQSPEETGAAINNDSGSGTSFVGKYGIFLPISVN